MKAKTDQCHSPSAWKRITSASCLLAMALSLAACNEGGNSSADNNSGSKNQEVNQAPTITGVAKSYIQATKPYSFIPDAEDADNDVLRFTANNLPGWAKFDNLTGELYGQPGATDVGQYSDITISVDDGLDTVALAPFTIEVLQPPLSRQNIDTGNANVVTTDSGFNAKGDVSVSTDNSNTELADADLQFTFDEDNNIKDVTGTALLPTKIGDNLLIPDPLTVKVGLYTGAQINADKDIGIGSTGGIRLLDDLQYLVFFLGTGLNVTLVNPNDNSQVPITLGIGNDVQSLIIMDPNDPMAYVFGYVGGAGFGTGRSLHGLLPFEPVFDNSSADAFTALDSFSGHIVDKGVFPIGIKIFDVLSISGERVIRMPVPGDIDWSDPLNSPLHFQAGFNGSADLNFGMLGVGLFSYHLADTSATFDVGLQRQHFAMQGVYQPTETSQPVWLPVRPSPEPTDKVVANIVADASGDFSMELRGQFKSTFPEAMLSGSMKQTLNGLTVTGTINDDVNPIQVSAKTTGSTFDASVHYAVDFNQGLKENVLGEFDSQLAEVQAAQESLTQAVTGYNYAVSLEGLRNHLPQIADTAIAQLDAVPGTVYNEVYKKVYDTLTTGSYCKTFTVPDPTWSDPLNTKDVKVCYNYKDYVDEVAVAKNAAKSAQTQARTEVDRYIAMFNDMKQYAGLADDDTVRAVLKSALLTVYSNQIINKTVSYTYKKTISGSYLGLYDWSYTINKTFNGTINQRVISVDQAADIKLAADNVDKIPSSYVVMIDAQDYVNSLPVEDALTQARQEVDNGLAKLPSFDGAGYTVKEGSTPTAYIQLSGKKYSVEFNLLDPGSIADNIVKLISSLQVPQ